MRTSDFDYHLPQELIAQTPVEPRDASRLLVLDRVTGALEHRTFSDLTEYLRPGDLLVANRSRVIPARLFGIKEGTGTRVEMLMLRPAAGTGTSLEWEVLLKPSRRLRSGTRISFGDGELVATVLSSDDLGVRRVGIESILPLDDALSHLGHPPLPPYIHDYTGDPERYQTVYGDSRGSAAAPTAGLHFTQELMKSIEESGVGIVYVLLHIGVDTFRPVQEEDPTEHPMHSEYYEVSESTARAVSEAKREGRRVIAVGTTSIRVLESVATDENPPSLRPGSGSTRLFIYPGYHFKVADAMITNFHLPRSTLIMLVSAFAGRERLLHAYEVAVRERYRFFSFGDAMLIR